MFSVIMGLAGFSIVLEKNAELIGFSNLINQTVLMGTLTLFLIFVGVYIVKLIFYREEVNKEFNHPIKVNFFSTTSISLLLLSIGLMSIDKGLAAPFWWVGTILQTIFLFNTIRFWIQRNFEIQFMNPAWFIPVVGNILIPIAGVEFMPQLFSYFYFSIGIFFWIVLFTIFFNRVIFHHQLPDRFMPTLFILIAPPAVGFVAYMKIFHDWNAFSQFLLMLAYFFVALLFFLGKSFLKLKFFISWWAFTFPLMAVSIASVMAYHSSHIITFKYIAIGLSAIAFLVISVVAIKTIQQVIAKNICIDDEH